MATPTITTPAPAAHTTRRNLLIADPAVAALVAVPGIAVAQGGDAKIEAAWERRQLAYAAYNAQPVDQPGLQPGEVETPEEKRLWAIIDEAEEVIRSNVATTPRGVAIQLWCCLYHSVAGREDDQAITRGDLDRLTALEGKLDWNTRLALAALRSLQAMGA